MVSSKIIFLLFHNLYMFAILSAIYITYACSNIFELPFSSLED